MAPASATPTSGASGYKTASKVVVTGIEPAAPAAPTQKNADYVYIGAPREKVAPVDTGRTEAVQHHLSHSAGPQNAHLPFNQFQCSCRHPHRSSVLEIPALISYARVSIWQHGGSGDTSADAVETGPHLVALTKHTAGLLTVLGASAAAEVRVLMDSGKGLLQCRRSW